MFKRLFSIFKPKKKIFPPYLYEMGSLKRYNGPSSLDLKVHLGDTKEGSKQPVLGNVQGISFGRRPDGKFGGSLVLVIMDSLNEVKDLVSKTKRLSVFIDSGPGVKSLANKVIRFDNYFSWGASIDDLILDATIHFTEIAEEDHEKD